MPGPAPAGLFVYAKDLPRLAAFYEAILGLARLHATDEIVVLDGPGVQLLVHAIPADTAARIEITAPPRQRWDAALKFFFTVPSIAEAATRAAALGGQVLDTEYAGSGFRVRNALDPEGNVFQVREPA